MTEQIDLQKSLSYELKRPAELGAKTQFSRYTPQNSAATYKAGDTLTVKYTDDSRFVIQDKSYVKFVLTPSAVGTLNKQGGSAVISGITDSFNGMSLQNCQNYNLYNATKLATMTSEQKQVNGVLQKYNETAGLATTVNGPITIVLPFSSSFKTDTLIPLAVLNSGLQQDFFLAPDAQVLSTGTYTISQFEVVLCLLTPSLDYAREFKEGLDNNTPLYLPLTLTKEFNKTLTTDTTPQNLSFSCNYLKSLNSATLIRKSALNTLINLDDIKSFYFMCDGTRYPINKQFVGAEEHLVQLLASSGSTANSMMSVPPADLAFKKYTWKINPDDFYTGIPTSNGYLDVCLEFTSGTVSGILEVVLEYDVYAEITKSGCRLIEAF